MSGREADDAARIARIGARLLSHPAVARTPDVLVPDWMPAEPFGRPPVLAAVLIALVSRPAGHTVLFTERSADLRTHSGQVAFPGGKVDPTDAGAGAAALREAQEEVALDPTEARILGYMNPYFTGTNYLITPVVAEVIPTAPFIANPQEVTAVFEVPLAELGRQASYGTFRVNRAGVEHTTWQIDHQGHRIWGITANITRQFYELALAPEAEW